MPAGVRDLTDAVVAITGATAGIGRQTARQLIEAGARVALLGRRQERLDELVSELGTDRAVAVRGDVGEPAASTELVARAVHPFGRLDSMVAKAGDGLYRGGSSTTPTTTCAT
jgi:3-oxoacyl-[acyl-carrier protein] reductase